MHSPTLTRRSLAITAFVVFLTGCASHEVVPSTTTRPPTSPQQVKIYPDFPHRYESLGLVTVPVTPEIHWDERGESTAGFDRLKAEAAAKGANGLLLKIQDGTYDLKATAGYHGQFYQIPMRRDPKAAVAEAVFVLEE